MIKLHKRRKLFDEDADWLPQKGKPFKMKTRLKEEPPKEELPKETPLGMTMGPPNIKYERMPKGWTGPTGKETSWRGKQRVRGRQSYDDRLV